MIKKIFITLFFIVTFATTTHATILIADDATLLTNEEESQLITFYDKSVMSKQNIDVIIYTNNTNTTKHETEATSFYSQHSNSPDCVMLYVNMNDRYIDVSAYGLLKDKITTDIDTLIYQCIRSKFTKGTYYKGCMKFLELENKCVKHPKLTGFSIWIVPIALFFFCVALISSMIILWFQYKESTGIKRATGETFLDTSKSNATLLRMDYTWTDIRKTRKSSNRSGGYGGGGGGSHGGGHF
jgi:uncharacterized membrane protein YgcG